MAFVSLYRKYRSQSFADLIGQDHVVRTLQNAIGSGRIAHAYLFTGPRGTGKTSTARLLAKALCCEKGPAAEPCNECSLCRAITDNSALDVHEMDAASEAGVDQVRETIVQTVEYQPAQARFRVFIIDEVHDLSAKAFDALLKTIEEPPSHVVFILATTEFVKVPPTIRSRCQKFEFHRASLTDLQKRLAFVAESEGIAIEPTALAAIARMSDGGYRDALTFLEQAALSTDGAITLETVYDQLGLVAEETSDRLLKAIIQSDVRELLATLAELGRRGRDPRSILESLLHRVSDLTASLYGLNSGADASLEAGAHAVAVQLGNESLLGLRGALAEAHRAIRDITLPRIWLESELIRISQRRPEPTAPAPEPRVETKASTPAPPKAAVRSEPTALAPTPKEPAPTPAPAKSAGNRKPMPQLASDVDPRWRTAFEGLYALSPAMSAKLSEARAEVDGDRLLLKLNRKMDFDWLNNDPRKLGAIQAQVDQAFGQTMRVELLHEPESKAPEARAVELELQGKDLYEAVQKLSRESHDETT